MERRYTIRRLLLQSTTTIDNVFRQCHDQAIRVLSRMVNRFIQKLSGLADLSSSDVAALEKAPAPPRLYGPRQDLIREGDEPGPMSVVRGGWICRYKILPRGTRQIMAFLMPGD